MPEIIEIGSSPEIPPPRTKSLHVSGKALNFSSDGFNSSIFDEDDWLFTRPLKKRRSNPVTEREVQGSERLVESWNATVSTENDNALPGPSYTERQSCSVTKSTTFPFEDDFSDAIVFTSSAPEQRSIQKAAPKECTVIALDEDPQYLDDEVFSFSQPTETRRHLSERTANLLADLNARAPTAAGTFRRPAAHPPHSKMSSARGSGAKSDRELFDPIFDSSPPVSAILPLPAQIVSKTTKETSKADERALAKATKEAAQEEGRERKRLAKEQKARQKLLLADIAEVNKAKHDKKISTPEMIVDLPLSINGTSAGNQVLEYMKHLGVETSSFDSRIVPGNVVKWRRKVKARFDEEAGRWEPVPEYIQSEKYIVCHLSAAEFIELAVEEAAQETEQDLHLHVAKLATRHPECKLIYLIEGLLAWTRKNRNNRNRAYQEAVRGPAATDSTGPGKRKGKKKAGSTTYVDEDAVEDALLQLQIQHRCLIYQTTCASDTAEWIKNYTEHISTVPYRQERMEAYNDAGFCMDIGQVKTGDNAQEVYIRMLQEVHRLTPPMAYGIANIYPNVRSLIAGFKQHGPAMLEDVKKSANKNGGVTEARLGPAISKRLYKVFLSTNPNSTEGEV